MSIQPLHTNVLVRITKPGQDRKTSTGIYVPDRVDDGLGRGVVVACGPRVTAIAGLDSAEPPRRPLVEGERVLFKRGDAVAVEEDGQTYALIEVAKVLAVIQCDGGAT